MSATARLESTPSVLAAALAAAFIDVADVGHLDVRRVLEQPGVVRAAAAAADQADDELVVGALGGADRGGRERRRGNRHRREAACRNSRRLVLPVMAILQSG